MMPVALDIEEMAASLNPADGTWRLSAGEDVYQLRPWTWGERRRLVFAATQAGRLDTDAFLAGLVGLLYRPAPPEALTPLFALAALRLMRVPGEGSAWALAEAERAFAERYGWLPGALESEPAGDLDRILSDAAPLPVHAPPQGTGWTSIRFDAPQGTGGTP